MPKRAFEPVELRPSAVCSWGNKAKAHPDSATIDKKTALLLARSTAATAKATTVARAVTTEATCAVLRTVTIAVAAVAPPAAALGAPRAVNATVTAKTTRAANGLVSLLHCSGNHVRRQGKVLPKILDTLVSKRVVVPLPAELLLHVILGSQRLHQLHDLQV